MYKSVKYGVHLSMWPPGDLVFFRESDNFVADYFVKGVISDHLAVNSVFRAHRPIWPQRIITFRRLKPIDKDSFRADLLSLPLISSDWTCVCAGKTCSAA